jgi:hypothetical protein
LTVTVPGESIPRMNDPWIVERKERAGDPDALAAIIYETDLVLASDLRGTLRDVLRDFEEEQADPGTPGEERRARMYRLLVSLDRRLGETDYVASDDHAE